MRDACLRILEHAPQHADAHFLIGVAYLSAGRAAVALDSLRRAAALAPGRADYWAQLARCLVVLRRERDALDAAERALSLEPGDAHTLDTLAVVHSRAGAHERAAALFRRAAALAPDRAELQCNLGTALRIVGDLAGAEAALERAVALEPRLYKAHGIISELRTQTPARNHVARLSALLESVGDDVDGELRLRHALAKELEDLGDFANAFAHLVAGKARKRAAIGYAFETDGKLFDAAAESSGPALVARAADGHDNAEPIFVVGMPRSGTTLVERILSGHSDVQSAGELQSFPQCVKRAAGTRSGLMLDPETVIAAAGTDLEALGRRYVESTRFVTGRSPRFVDKQPLNFFLVGLIAAALPNAKIVCVRRGALDTCVANYRRLFAANSPYHRYTYDLLDIGRYYVRFDALMRHWRSLLGERLFEIRYEALIEDPRREAGRLLEHVGLAWQDACLDVERNPAPVATASAVQVREPLHARGIGRWRRYANEIEPLRAALAAAGISP